MVILYVAGQTPKIDNLWCSLKNGLSVSSDQACYNNNNNNIIHLYSA